ncbi:MAG TPA: T9SS type A sorting domain-containing protein [Bacteroidia bacterium]|nr:T9SS type A sorting domain-containing protein [Bacteroidia bacterium]
MKKQLLTLLSLFFICSSFLQAQPWMRMAEAKKANPDFFDIQAAFNEYEKSFQQEERFAPMQRQPWETEEKGIPGFLQYKRWEWFWESRVTPAGEFPNPQIILSELQNANSESNRDASAVANWTLMGPISSVPTGGGGMGRINCVRFNPLNANIVWAGAPSGGLWKSTNGGTNWTTNTDQLAVIGVTDVAINPQDTSVMYIATGDGDAGDTYSVGVLKSTNSGATWNATGLTWNVSSLRRISRLLIDPANPSNLLAATSYGIYRSTDAGALWAQMKTGNYMDMEFMPGNPGVVYAASTDYIFKSTNGGATWGAASTTGVPTSNVQRIALAVTAANPNVLYALYANSADQGFLGFYKSTNAAVSFTQMSTTPNILGWSQTGNDVGGQGWYDLALAASPTNENFVLVGGVRIWKSSNGGTSWTISAYNSVHADVHDLAFANGSGSLAYTGSDGGVFNHPAVTGSAGWTNKSATLQIMQNYKMSNAATNSSIVVAGSQDNGTNKVNGTTVSKILGGDGMECIVDYTDVNIIYGESQFGNINKSTDGGSGWNQISPTGNADGAWVTPYVMHPSNHNILYLGYNLIYKTTDGGNTWNGGTNSNSATFRSMAVAPSNGNYVYAATLSSIWRSSDGANTWTNITAGLPVSSAYISYITVKYNDPNTLWVTFSSYSSSIKVYKSTDAGATWTNISGTGLPAVPVNCIVNQLNDTNQALYVGTDIGVYYKDNTLSAWVAYNTNLPRVIVSELEIHNSASKLRAATYGRGIWQSDLTTPVGIVEQQKQAVFNVYPNPSHGFLNIEVTNDADISSVKLFDVAGKKVKEIESPLLNSGVVRINISDLPNGVYSVNLKDKSGIKSAKVSLVR